MTRKVLARRIAELFLGLQGEAGAAPTRRAARIFIGRAGKYRRV